MSKNKKSTKKKKVARHVQSPAYMSIQRGEPGARAAYLVEIDSGICVMDGLDNLHGYLKSKIPEIANLCGTSLIPGIMVPVDFLNNREALNELASNPTYPELTKLIRVVDIEMDSLAILRKDASDETLQIELAKACNKAFADKGTKEEKPMTTKKEATVKEEVKQEAPKATEPKVEEVQQETPKQEGPTDTNEPKVEEVQTVASEESKAKQAIADDITGDTEGQERAADLPDSDLESEPVKAKKKSFWKKFSKDKKSKSTKETIGYIKGDFTQNSMIPDPASYLDLDRLVYEALLQEWAEVQNLHCTIGCTPGIPKPIRDNFEDEVEYYGAMASYDESRSGLDYASKLLRDDTGGSAGMRDSIRESVSKHLTLWDTLKEAQNLKEEIDASNQKTEAEAA